MKKFVATLIALLPLLLIFGCGDDITEYYDESYVDGRILATIHGVVTDGANNERLVNVTVWTSVNGNIVSTVTNAQGYYALSGLVPGEYNLTFVHPYTEPTGKALNYGVSCTDVSVDNLEDIGMDEQPHTEDFNFSVVEDMMMYPLTADLTGQIFQEVDEENTVPAVGVTIIADFWGFNLSVDEYTATSDSTGTYTFTGLPATATVETRNLPYNDGTNNFDVDTESTGLVPDGAVFADPLEVERTGIDAVILENNFGLDDFGVEDNIIMVFSVEMVPEFCEVVLYNGMDEVPGLTTWAADGLSVTYDPYMTLLAGDTYTVVWNLDTIDGVSYNDSYNFDTVVGIEMIYCNLETADEYRDDFPIDSAVEVTFNIEPDLTNLNTSIVLSRDGGPALFTTVTLDSLELTITPTADLTPDTDYTLNFTVWSEYVGDVTTESIDFTTARAVTAPGAVAGFAVEDDQLTYDFDTTDFDFVWDAVTGADGYYIYAANDIAKSDLVRVGSYDDDATSGSVDISAAQYVDVFGDEPLVNGTEISFQILAYNDAGMSALSSAIDITDDTGPTIGIGIQSATADNSAGIDDLAITIVLTSSEPLDPTVEPSLDITEAGGDAGYRLPEAAVTFEFDEDLLGGTFTLVIPAGEDASGDVFEVSDCDDSSGNTQEAAVTLALG